MIRNKKLIKSSTLEDAFTVYPWSSECWKHSDHDLGLSYVVEAYGEEFLNLDDSTLNDLRDTLIRYFDNEAYVRDWNINYPDDQIEEFSDIMTEDDLSNEELARYFDYERYGRDIRLENNMIWDNKRECWFSGNDTDDYDIDDVTFLGSSKKGSSRKAIKSSVSFPTEKDIEEFVNDVNSYANKGGFDLYNLKYKSTGKMSNDGWGNEYPEFVIYDDEGTLDLFEDDSVSKYIRDKLAEKNWYAELKSSSSDFVIAVDNDKDYLKSSRKPIKSSALPDEIYYIVVNGSKFFYKDKNELEEQCDYLYQTEGKKFNIYTENDPEEIEEVFEAGILKSSHKQIKSAVDGGWRVDSSDVPEALDLFVEYVGEETALEAIARAMGPDTLEENIEYVARQWDIAEDIEDLNAWEAYEKAKEIMGVSELFTNLTQAAGYDELAGDLAFIFRMYDFREWNKYDNDNDEE